MRAYNESRGDKQVAMLFDGWDYQPIDLTAKPSQPEKQELSQAERSTADPGLSIARGEATGR